MEWGWLLGDFDCLEHRKRAEGGRPDDWMSDDADLELHAVSLPKVEREGSDCLERCRPVVADCTPG